MIKAKIISATAAEGQIRIYACIATQLCEDARATHQLSKGVTVAFGRFITGAALMAGMMKNEDEVLTLQMKGDGPVNTMTVTANPQVEVKGYVTHPDVEGFDTDKIGSLIGEGQLSVIKDIGLKEPYIGTSPIITGEIAEDLTYYYAMSEQIPTSIALGVQVSDAGRVTLAGGFVLQLMPFADERLVTQLEQLLAKSDSVIDIIESGNDAKGLILHLLKDFDPQFLGEKPLAYVCDCSHQKVSQALLAIGEKDLKELKEEEEVEVKCDFCNKTYTFSSDEIATLLDYALDKKIL
ncbi:MAG: Hsp33 family molecular chaperone HslO [Eubacteriaceae bacterium]|jgi:molecular chaperone Hsp33|nr:Hsp33 family molecular chaperone HslO [Eubacteriaceae bacterium]